MPKLYILILLIVVAFSPVKSLAIGDAPYIQHVVQKGDFQLVNNEQSAPLVINSFDYEPVVRAVGDLQRDIQRVTGVLPSINHTLQHPESQMVLIGTIGKSPMIDQLIARHKLWVDSVKGKWEAFTLQVIQHPYPGVESALVIAGSDMRGTIYGIYDLSEQIGVSPWYWWDDVKPIHQSVLAIKKGFSKSDWPAVKYRGIFINDEAPCLSTWVKNFYGGVFDHQFYAHVFELILRLKGNYLWPAMWGKAFAIDDPENPVLANKYGIVMGTSHHEPMMRNQKEWAMFGHGAWNFETNRDELVHFWEKGIERNKHYEDLITIGMRGDGDEPMNNKSVSYNIHLMQQIIDTQESIIARFLNPDVSKVPQIWALYKEVQSYYDHGMKVPDYVTLLWCDDNWGNLRRLPSLAERNRTGGAGIYYHVDYVGGPRSYKWLNTVPITKIWEQMSKAYDYDARKVWILNVGDIKLLEYPIDFFMNLAWNPHRWNRDNLYDFTRLWAVESFGQQHADAIADLLMKYSTYNGRIKPELISPNTFSLLHYDEADRVANDWKILAHQADSLAHILPTFQHDAYYELVQYPVDACANLNQLYVDVAKNRLYAFQGRTSANLYADSAKACFAYDARLTYKYHHQIANGRWNGVIGQSHIGYRSWMDPPHNIMPETDSVSVKDIASMGVAVEGDSSVASEGDHNHLPDFDSFTRPTHYVDVFNKGTIPFLFTVSANSPWIIPSVIKGIVKYQQRVIIAIDWNKVPFGSNVQGTVFIKANGQTVPVEVTVFHPESPARNHLHGFVETDGYVSMDATHYTKRHDVNGVGWRSVPWYGREFSSMMPVPDTTASTTDLSKAPYLEYSFYLNTKGPIDVNTLIAPTLNCLPDAGLRFAVAFDNQPAQIVSIPKIDITGEDDNAAWSRSVIDNIRVCTTKFINERPGYHTLRIYMIDPIVVLQKIVINTGGLKSSFLFPPESYKAGQ